jgi:hypothetical protein
MSTDVASMETLTESEAEALLEAELSAFAARFAADRPDRKDSWC